MSTGGFSPGFDRSRHFPRDRQRTGRNHGIDAEVEFFESERFAANAVAHGARAATLRDRVIPADLREEHAIAELAAVLNEIGRTKPVPD